MIQKKGGIILTEKCFILPQRRKGAKFRKTIFEPLTSLPQSDPILDERN